ncbi:protein DEK-like [Stegastes partitus]|uniref:Protein DEK-like n=1 Tax=Stegastes partitus TaxID=144197 RepID=A0A9Y4NER2_9TELE|nr:PREDICTED: protein DEK-like [Stegastes partitus]
MPKTRQSAETAATTKTPKQVLKSRAAKPRASKKDADSDFAEKEEKLERKVKPKPRSSLKRAAGKTSSSKPTSSAAVKTTKCFQSPVKEEEDSEDAGRRVVVLPHLIIPKPPIHFHPPFEFKPEKLVTMDDCIVQGPSGMKTVSQQDARMTRAAVTSAAGTDS